jgi:hypothetical protein
MAERWVDLREAAELLGTSTEAVRKRATRRSLRSDRYNTLEDSEGSLAWIDHMAAIRGYSLAVNLTLATRSLEDGV